MEKRKVGIISLCVLLAAYLLFRYPLFGLHGMKRFPLVLLVAGIAVIAVFGVVKGGRMAPLYTTVSYIVGFFVAYLLERITYDPGGGTMSNFWQIWLGGFIGGTVSGVFVEIRRKKAP